jgi:hypothetical protein
VLTKRTFSATRHRIDDLGRKLDAMGIVGEEGGALGGNLLHDLDHLG